eukprot:15482959-Alexandrium_andersonii.AAC.1
METPPKNALLPPHAEDYEVRLLEHTVRHMLFGRRLHGKGKTPFEQNAPLQSQRANLAEVSCAVRGALAEAPEDGVSALALLSEVLWKAPVCSWTALPRCRSGAKAHC